MADIFGQDGRDDTLTGGVLGSSTVNDDLYGRTGNDTYQFTEFSGFDDITDTGGNDRLLLDASISPGHVRLDGDSSSDHLYVTVVDDLENVQSQIRVLYQFDGQAVETLAFANGTTLSLIGGLTIEGTVGNTELQATGFADTLISTTRDEDFYGKAGNDTYTFSDSFGFDDITDTGGNDRLLLDASISPGHVRLDGDSSSDHLYVTVVDDLENVQSQIRVLYQFDGQAVETLAFANGTTLSLIGGLTIQGTVGNTELQATGFADTLISTTRDEDFYGKAGNDTYTFSDSFGFDDITDTGGNDRLLLDASISPDHVRLDGDSSSDHLYVTVVDDLENVQSQIRVLYQFDGQAVETLAFANGTTLSLIGGLTIQGTVGNTELHATGFADTLISTTRDEDFYGKAGNDTYTFSDSFGFDDITDTGGNDRLLLDASISPDHVRLDGDSSSDHLYVTVVDDLENVQSQIRVLYQFDGQAIETLAFADGTTMSLIGGLTVQGYVDNNLLYGSSQADTFIGSTRDEEFYGGIGNDTYRLRGGFGADFVDDTGGLDTLHLIRIDADQIGFTRTFSNHLLVSIRNSGGTVIDQVYLLDYFDSGSYRVETLLIGDQTYDIARQLAGATTTERDDVIASILGDTVINAKGGDDLVTDLFGSNTVDGGKGDDVIRTGAGRDKLTGGDGADRLDAGAQADRMTGGTGADVFLFAKRYGRDVITDFGDGADVLMLNDNLWRGNLTVEQVIARYASDTGNDVLLDFGRLGSITLVGVGNLQALTSGIEIV